MAAAIATTDDHDSEPGFLDTLEGETEAVEIADWLRERDITEVDVVGVATGAADGYARIAGTPAATLLHLGPGMANGLANLHNARRAGSPTPSPSTPPTC